MSTLREQFDHDFRYYAEQIGKFWQLREVVEELGLLDLDIYVNKGTSWYDSEAHKSTGPYIELEPRHVPGIGIRAVGPPDLEGIAFGLTDTTPTLGDAAKVLLPKIGRFEKGYDARNNLLTLTAHYKGVRIVLKDTPPDTCTVEKVEEEEELPASPAYTRTVTRYRLIGDCNPLLGPKTNAQIEAEAGE